MNAVMAAMKLAGCYYFHYDNKQTLHKVTEMEANEEQRQLEKQLKLQVYWRTVVSMLHVYVFLNTFSISCALKSPTVFLLYLKMRELLVTIAVVF